MKNCSLLAVAVGLAAMFSSALWAVPTTTTSAKDAYTQKVGQQQFAAKAKMHAKAVRLSRARHAKHIVAGKAHRLGAHMATKHVAKHVAAHPQGVTCKNGMCTFNEKPSVKKAADAKK